MDSVYNFAQNKYIHHEKNPVCSNYGNTGGQRLVFSILYRLCESVHIMDKETEYPYGLGIRLSVRCDRPFVLRVRIPEWSAGYESDTQLAESGGYLECMAEDGDVIDISFSAEVRTETLAGKTYFAYGPQIYALPLEAVEVQGRVYADGYFDTVAESSGNVSYSFVENHGAVFSGGRLEVTLRNNVTGKE